MLSAAWSYAQSALKYAGFAPKSWNILVLGMDNTGKSTLVRVLNWEYQDLLYETPITSWESLITIPIAKAWLTIRKFTICGMPSDHWNWQMIPFDAIVFFVDTTDSIRFAEVKFELERVLEQEKRNVPFAVFGNKMDDRRSVSEERFRKSLGLEAERLRAGARQMDVFMGSVHERHGYREAFRFIARCLQES